MAAIILLVLKTIFIYMTAWYILALLLKRNDIADIAWGPGFVVVCLSIYLSGNSNSIFATILWLILFWGVRLFLHIFSRNKGKSEDFRYKKWRETWGNWFYIRTFLQVFMLQGFFMFLISLPAIVASQFPVNVYLGIISWLGVVIWIIGFIFESVGDYQLRSFISNTANKGKIMTQGLWSYTRHPNYFGEVTQWWGIFVVFLGTLPSNYLELPYILLVLISPLTITFLILKVSGIPMLEKKYEGNPEFEAYKNRTNAFFPWFPKNQN